MELILFFLFVAAIILTVKNIFYQIFIILFFFFCAGRFILAGVDESYIIGGEEWVFPGSSSITNELYFSAVIVFMTVFLLSVVFFDIKNKENNICYELKNSSFFYAFVCFVILFSFYKGWLYLTEISAGGYLSAVDMKVPIWLSIITTSFCKPLALAIILLRFLGRKKNIKILNIAFVVLLVLMSLSGQRKDIVSILLFFIGFPVVFLGKKVYKLYIGMFLIALMAIAIFWMREENVHFSNNFISDLIWSTGFSINSGLFVVENKEIFYPSDALFFLNTYFYCGIGKIYSDICYSDIRLQESGFLLEKIASQLDLPDTTFGGIGGNIIGSLFVSSGFGHVPDIIAGGLFICYCCVLCYVIKCVFVNMKVSVVWALCVCQIIIGSRYAFDGLIPPLNQLIAAVFIDKLFLRKSCVCYENDK